MGKNKKKINNVFKVAGAKSLKLKAKAKPVKSDLKNIKLKTQLKTLEIDKALAQLQDTIRQSPAASGKPQQSHSKLPTIDYEKAAETQKKSEENVEDLTNMRL